MMKALLCTFFILVPLMAFSQENTNKKATDPVSEIENLKKRVSELERIKSKVRIAGKEETYHSFPKIKFDFKKPDSITIPRKIKEGEFYQIQVTGINLNQYVLVMENSDTVYSTPLSFPVFGTLDLSSLSNLVSSLAVSTGISGDLQLTKALSMINKSFPQEKSIRKDSLEKADEDIARLFEEYIRDMAQQKKKEDLRGLITSRVKKEATQASVYLAKLKNANEAIDDKKYSYMAYRVLRQTDDTSDNYKPLIKDDLKVYADLRSLLKELKDDIDADAKSIKDFTETDSIKVFLADTKNVDLKDNLAKAEKVLTEAAGKTAKALDMISSDNIEKQLRSVVNLYTDNSYTSLPIQYNGEQAMAKIKFIPKDSASALQSFYLPAIKFPHQRFYWSVGPSIYYANLMSERVGTQTIQVNDSTQRYQILKESPLEGEMGAALLLRGGAKLWKPSMWLPSLGLHFTAGTGLSLGEEVRPRMLLGGGITLGQKHSLAIDAGWIGGYVQVVSASADYNQLYIEKPAVLVNDFKSKLFWSVGYAFRL